VSGALTDTELPGDPILERRALVQATARRSLKRRNAVSSVMLGLCGAAFALAAIVLVWIIFLLINRGMQWWSVAFFTQVPTTPTVLQPNAIGGISTAIAGSLSIDACAIVMAVPVGIIGGLLLAEADNPVVNLIRRVAEVMTGLPSILFGLFVFAILILKFNVGFAGIDGSAALAILMIPVIMKSSEIAFRQVPNSYKEAGLALGLSKGRVSRSIVVPTAVPGLLTSVLIAASRAVGETAPLLLVIGVTYKVQWNPLKQQAALPVTIFNNVTSGLAPAQTQQAWGIALFLAALVLVLNLGSRGLTAFLQRERH
jgi:phosphate transport system permease protein